MPKPRIRDTDTAQKMLGIRRAEYRKAVEALTDKLAAGDISLVQWRAAMRQEIKGLHTAALIFGRGGEYESLTQSDFGGLGADLKKQYYRFDELAQDIQGSVGGSITPDWINLRASAYGDLADTSFWRGVGKGFPDIPPRIRSTEVGLKLLNVRQKAFNKTVVNLNGKLRTGDISVEQWRAAMRQEIKDVHTAALIIARGGEYGEISQADWGRLGAQLKKQYKYLDGYAAYVQESAEADLVGEGKFLSGAYMDWRSKLYGGAAKASYWQHLVYGKLPQVPGDGQTRCGSNCGCHLRIEDGDDFDTLLVYWELGPTEHCDDCVRLSNEWRPFILEMPPSAAKEAASLGLSLAGFVETLLTI